jgi:hypothetical protein
MCIGGHKTQEQRISNLPISIPHNLIMPSCTCYRALLLAFSYLVTSVLVLLCSRYFCCSHPVAMP